MFVKKASSWHFESAFRWSHGCFLSFRFIFGLFRRHIPITRSWMQILQKCQFSLHWLNIWPSLNSKLLNAGVHVLRATDHLTFLGPSRHCNKWKQCPQLKLCCCAFLFYSIKDDAFAFANQVGYPCLLRPSYVLRWDLPCPFTTCQMCECQCSCGYCQHFISN